MPAARPPRKRGGKYAHVIDKLPKTFNLEVGYQERVDIMIDHFRKTTAEAGVALDASTLAALYEEVRLEKNQIDDELSEANLKLEAVEQMVVKEFDACNITTVKTKTGSSIRAEVHPHAVVTNKEIFRLWCLDNGYAEQMTLPWATTNALVKERILEAEKDPPGIEVVAMPRVVFRKGE